MKTRFDRFGLALWGAPLQHRLRSDWIQNGVDKTRVELIVIIPALCKCQHNRWLYRASNALLEMLYKLGFEPDVVEDQYRRVVCFLVSLVVVSAAHLCRRLDRFAFHGTPPEHSGATASCGIDVPVVWIAPNAHSVGVRYGT